LSLAIRILRFSENFFLLAAGSGGRPDPERRTRPRARARDSGDDRDRTGNLRLAKPALSQLSYVPGILMMDDGQLIIDPAPSTQPGPKPQPHPPAPPTNHQLPIINNQFGIGPG
jgi:hypothetical protein